MGAESPQFRPSPMVVGRKLELLLRSKGIRAAACPGIPPTKPDQWHNCADAQDLKKLVVAGARNTLGLLTSTVAYSTNP